MKNIASIQQPAMSTAMSQHLELAAHFKPATIAGNVPADASAVQAALDAVDAQCAALAEELQAEKVAHAATMDELIAEQAAHKVTSDQLAEATKPS